MKISLYRFCLLLVLNAGCILAQSQSRDIVNLNKDWAFIKDSGDISNSTWKTVQLPNSWNTADVMDEQPGYYRSAGLYKRNIAIKKADKNKLFYLRFEGVNQVTKVFVNRQLVGSHTGGYTAFQFLLNPFLNFNDDPFGNEITVRVDNSYDPQVPPLTADFTFFGGIYRDVWLISVPAVHFSFDQYGSNGLFVSTPHVSAEKAGIHINGTISNDRNDPVPVKIRSVITDRNGKRLQEKETTLNLLANSETRFEQSIDSFIRPHLWSPDDPYLYRVNTTITDLSSGKLLDELSNPVGFRWFKFDANDGFFLNGKPLKLIGASRHQDRPGIGNAVSNEMAREDIGLLKKMGGNFLRVAHYPQDPAVMQACDELGILASVEIPIVNEITESDSFYNNCDTMLVEMIRQNYNHPSVIIWCYMNEVLLRPHFNEDKERQKIYFSNIVKLARRLDSACRKEDPSRYTMIANHGDFDRYYNTGLTGIPMIVGWNIYSGWYGGQMENFPVFLDKHHQLLPAKPVVVSEYGADADPRIRSFHPVKFDKSVEYSLRFHQYYLQEILKRPFVSAGMIWNLADFNSETREETMPHMNNKGMLMWDRTPKDLYYFYKALLTKEPFLKITSAYWSTRSGNADSNNTRYQPLQVASNFDSVELIVNGRSQGWKKPLQGLCAWSIPLKNKTNIIEAKAKNNGKWFSDQANIEFRLQPYYLPGNASRFEELNVILGADRYFFDKKKNMTWQPDQPYRPGSFGHIGGQPFKLGGNTRLPYGSDKNILGTDNDPVYQTQLAGIKSYRIDVPAGEYELTLHFAELQGGVGKNLVYNLSDSVARQEAPHRRFNVSLNGKSLLENFDIAQQYGITTVVVKKYTVIVKNKEGIVLDFQSLEGEPVLNALQLKRIK